MHETDLAWAAGFIDGEGTISLVFNSGHIGPLLTAYNNDLRPLYKLKDMFGGAVVAKPRKDKQTLAYYWRCGTRAAVKAARLLEPYLVVKREQARIIIDYAKLIHTSNQTVTDAEWNQRLVLMAEVRTLNKRGPRDVSA